MPKTTDIIRKEINNQNQGKGSDAGTRKVRFGRSNPTKSGGVNRATKGK
jgi:hypothetical protein